MNRAALYSAEVLARFEQEQLQKPIASEQRHFTLQSGRAISKRPFAFKSDETDMSRAMVKFSSSPPRPEIDVEEYDGDAGDGGNILAEQRAMAKQLLAMHQRPFPASTVGVPGEAGAGQIATLQAKLQQRLGPEYISNRQGPAGGGRLSYIEGWKAIDLANEVFGFNGWSSQVIKLEIDFMDEAPGGGRYNVGVSGVVRISLRDGTYHEDVGYGHCENVKMKHQALEKAKKEAITDATKRALRTFGRMLGNCLYDKKFVETVSKIKVPAPTYDVTALKRDPEVRKQVPAVAQLQEASTSASIIKAPPAHLVQVQKENRESEQQVRPEETTALDQAYQKTNNDYRRNASIDDEKKQKEVTKVENSLKLGKILTKEERLALAAAKKASLQKRQAGERTRKSSATPIILEEVERGAGSQSIKRSSAREDDSVDNVDEYDLALMEVDINYEGEGYEQVENSVINHKKRAQSSSLDDSAIVMKEIVRQPNKGMPVKQATSVVTVASRGRFVDSSPSRDYSSNRLTTTAALNTNSNNAMRRGMPSLQKQSSQSSRHSFSSSSSQQMMHSEYKRGTTPAQSNKLLPNQKKIRPNDHM